MVDIPAVKSYLTGLQAHVVGGVVGLDGGSGVARHSGRFGACGGCAASEDRFGGAGRPAEGVLDTAQGSIVDFFAAPCFGKGFDADLCSLSERPVFLTCGEDVVVDGCT